MMFTVAMMRPTRHGDSADGGADELGEQQKSGLGVVQTPVSGEQRQDGAEQHGAESGEDEDGVHQRQGGCRLGWCGQVRLAEWLRDRIVNLHGPIIMVRCEMRAAWLDSGSRF